MKSRRIVVFLCLLLAVPAMWVSPAQAASAHFSGEGTKESPFLINHPEDLVTLAQVYYYYPGKYFRQTADIDLSGFASMDGSKGWIPIGWIYEDFPSFQAYYDGGGHAIRNLTIDRASESYLGLFGMIGPGGVVANVNIEGATITGGDTIGGLAGINQGTIRNVTIRDVTINGSRTLGGLVGTNDGVIAESGAELGVESVYGIYGTVGGLVGTNDNGIIIGSHVTGQNSVTCVTYGTDCDIVSESSSSGGVAGSNSGLILKSRSSASVKGASNAGGLAGSNDYGGIIERSQAFGDVVSTTTNSIHTGGLVGQNYGEIVHSSAAGSVRGVEHVGGLVGSNWGQSAKISWSRAEGNVSGKNKVGGLAGENTENNVITRSSAAGSVSGESHTGGLVGNNSGTVTFSHAVGDVQGNGSYIGGLIGYQSGIVEDSYATGNVLNTETSLTGGLTGFHSGLSGATRRAYSTGSVSSGFGVAGATGGTYEAVYWNMDTSGTDVSGSNSNEVKGLTAEEMTDPSSFQGWNFQTVWEMREGAPGPTLRVNRQFLEDLIGDASEVMSAAAVGTEPGQYPAEAADQLGQAIAFAQQKMAQQSVTYEDLLEAYDRLDSALRKFADSVIPLDISLAIAEAMRETSDLVAIHLIFDRDLRGLPGVYLERSHFVYNDPELYTYYSSFKKHEGIVELFLFVYGPVTADQPSIAVLEGAIKIDGVPNGSASTARLITLEEKNRLRADLLAEVGGNAVTVQHLVHIMGQPEGDISGDGAVSFPDILFLLRQLDPVITPDSY